MLKQSLQQKLLQRLSPQQIQFIKLLQVPTFALEQRVKQELEDNPALEEGKDDELEFAEDVAENEPQDESQSENGLGEDQEINIEDYLQQDDDIASYKLYTNNRSPDDDQKDIPVAISSTFHEGLTAQLGMCELSDHEHVIAEQIIGSIDDDGYLRRDLAAIVDDLVFTQNVVASEEEIQRVLGIIQKFDPVGVGARNLQECLTIQLNRKESKTAAIKTALDIVVNHLDAFTRKHYEKLSLRLDISNDKLKEAIAEILKLNPKPGSTVADGHRAQHIIPDFIVINNDGVLEVQLNARNAPDLRVSAAYHEMFETYNKTKKKDKQLRQTVQFVKQKLDSARWFVDAIKQRQDTLMRAMTALVDLQYEYFLTGDESKLRPMILKDIAEKIDMDLSTISRVANSKYVQTEFGTFLLKTFFSESMQKDTGETVSTREVKTLLRDLIESEDKKNPLPDENLADILKSKGYSIARRTVAKYREQLNFSVARLRKQL